MVKIQSGTLADVKGAAAFLAANGLSSDALPSSCAEAASILFSIAWSGEQVLGLARGSQAREARGVGAVIPQRFHVNTVIVDPMFRGAGVGQGLVEQLLGDAFVRGFSSAQLWVHTDNVAALLLYGKFGFVPLGGEVEDDRFGRIQQMSADLGPCRGGQASDMAGGLDVCFRPKADIAEWWTLYGFRAFVGR